MVFGTPATMLSSSLQPKSASLQPRAFVAASSPVNSMNANLMAEFGSPHTRQSTTLPQSTKKVASCSSVT